MTGSGAPGWAGVPVRTDRTSTDPLVDPAHRLARATHSACRAGKLSTAGLVNTFHAYGVAQNKMQRGLQRKKTKETSGKEWVE